MENILANGTPDFTTNEGWGMYATQDDYGTSFYFRGPAYTNWAYFAGYYWRIIRINGDGFVRMIYTGSTAPTLEQMVNITGTGTQIGTLAFNTTYSRAEYSGYMYTLNNAHGYGTSSVIKSNTSYGLDKWYQTHLASYASYISDTLFCADRVSYTDYNGTTPGGGTGTTQAYFAGYVRAKAKTPTLLCSNKNDRFTVSDTAIGNGALTYPIGLITVDEIMMAGNRFQTSADWHGYLYTDEDYWTMSPSMVYSGKAGDFFYSSNGGFREYYSNEVMGIRPVINVKGNIVVTGTGEFDDPYTSVSFERGIVYPLFKYYIVL